MICNLLNYRLNHFLGFVQSSPVSFIIFPGTIRYLSESLVPVKSISTYNYFVWKIKLSSDQILRIKL